MIHFKWLKWNAALPRKAKALEKSFKKLFPHIPIKINFSGQVFLLQQKMVSHILVQQRTNTYFALGVGRNGVTFSVIAA